MKPKATLVEQSFIKQHMHFDSAPYSNIRMVDVARVLDTETARTRLNPSVIAKLLDRVMTGLEHTIIALQGRPEGTRVVGLLHRSINRLLAKIPEMTNESLAQMHGVLSQLPLDDGPRLPEPPASPLHEKLVLRNYREYAKKVADAYDARPVRDPAARESYRVLIRHVHRMFKQLLSRIRIEFVDEPEPYKDAADMTRRVREEGVMYVSTLFSENLASGMTARENWMFRAVHDYIVHIGGRHDFSLRGEIGTFNRHAKVAPVAARPALFSEIVGQVAYAIVRGKFPNPQKACVLYGFDYVKVGVIHEEEYKLNWSAGVTESLNEAIEFRNVGKSPLDYNRGGYVERIALCDTSVTEPPNKHDTYFAEIERWRRRSKRGKRLKRPVLDEIIPGVGDNCIVAFLDFTDQGHGSYYINYVKSRNDMRGKRYISRLIEHFYATHRDAKLIHWGKMMHPAIGHLLDKMKAKYPEINSIGSRNF